jgi:hypothetical protein
MEMSSISGPRQAIFPLVDPSRRCRSHLGDLTWEEPLFLDPGGTENPEDHIEFLAEQPRVKNGSPRGSMTIDALGLRRELLREQRFDRWRKLSALQKVVRLLPEEPEGREALAILEDAIRGDAEYAAMARCLRARPEL